MKKHGYVAVVCIAMAVSACVGTREADEERPAAGDTTPPPATRQAGSARRAPDPGSRFLTSMDFALAAPMGPALLDALASKLRPIEAIPIRN